MLVDALKRLGFDARKPKGTFYCYVKCLSGAGKDVVFESAEQTAKYFIEKALISVVPWDDAGPYLRFSVTFEASSEKEEAEIISEMKRRLGNLHLIF